MKKEDNNSKEKAFEYFKIHSTQRTTHFNYFIIGITALLAIIVDKELSNFQMVLIGAFISLLSLIFYYFDLRNKELIKMSESYLSQNSDSNNFFTYIESQTDLERSKYSFVRSIFRSHGQIYKILYLSVFSFGILLSIFALINQFSS